ncbi:hypothetical protein GQ457_13G019270 [Hibiscus cannabinus]
MGSVVRNENNKLERSRFRMTQTVRRFRAMMRELSPSIVFLIETKLQSQKLERIQRLCGFPSGIDVSAICSSGGISLDVKIDEGDGTDQWRFIGFHSAPKVYNSISSWNLLRSLNDIQDVPWCVMGDFNEILSVSKRQINNFSEALQFLVILSGLIRNDWQINNFSEALQDCSLGPGLSWQLVHMGMRAMKKENKLSVHDLQKRNKFLSAQPISEDVLGELMKTKLAFN